MKGKKSFSTKSTIGQRKRTEKIFKLTKKNMSRRIRHYFKSNLDSILENRPKITYNYLNHHCNDSGACVALGKETSKINKFFNHFVDFDLVSPIVEELNEGSNGIVFEIEYRKHSYSAHSILKTIIYDRYVSDSLAYEYLVGKQVNVFMKQYPCFIETYGIFRTPDPKMTSSKYMKRNKKLKELIPMETDNLDTFIKDSCKYYLQSCILIQHIKSVKTVFGYFKNFLNFDSNYTKSIMRDENNYKNSWNLNEKYLIMSCLYQIYMPLAHLANYFTHYDLHAGNVLVYIPKENHYIEYYYHLLDGTTTNYKSPYLLKMIDYGRSFFKSQTDTEYNSKKILEKVCLAVNECYECGIYKGYELLKPLDPLKDPDPYSQFYIVSSEANISHDLNLLYNFQEFLGLTVKYIEVSGTPACTDKQPGIINNVMDAFEELNRQINSPVFKQWNDTAYAEMTLFGEMHIYANGRDAVFKPVL